MKIPIIKCDPVITPDIFETLTTGGDAIIIEAFATGQVPLRLTAAIKARVDAGIPVFILADNFGTDHGIVDADNLYSEQKDTGAIPIETINTERLQDLVTAIQEELEAGKKGPELGEAIRKRFAYGENETRPRPEWERDPDALPRMRNRKIF